MSLQQYQYYRPETEPSSVALELPITAPKPKRRLLKRITLVLFILLLVVILSVGWVGWQLFNSSTAVFGGTPTGNALALLSPASLDQDEKERTNILITGNSVDNPGHPGAKLTDSIMILSVDQSDNSAFLLSIPRDLLVTLPNYGYSKINNAYPFGEAEGTGGITLLSKVIENNLGLDIHYHTLVNYAAVRETVNAVDGVEVNIKSVDPRGLYDPNIAAVDGGPLQLKNGPQHLDGQTALNFSRARGESTPSGLVGYGFPRSDFNRTEHQRQLLTALKEKILSPDVLLNPSRLGNVFEAVGNNITTDLKINEAYRLANALRNISKLQPISLSTDDQQLLTGYSSYGLGSALIPSAGIDNFLEIQQYLDSL